MARIITKELALKIVEKLQAKKVKSKGKAHDLYAVEINGRLIAMLSIRRGSEKDQGRMALSYRVNRTKYKDLRQFRR